MRCRLSLSRLLRGGIGTDKVDIPPTAGPSRTDRLWPRPSTLGLAARVGGPFEGARLLLLTTTGARTGKSRTVILGYYPDISDRVLVVGSAGGGPKQPGWYHNLLANPACTVETGLFTYPAEALVLRDAERDQTFARLAEADPGWAKYQSTPPAPSRSWPSSARQPARLADVPARSASYS
ncbi:nitroreductase family deazaflavin-dependent oxidoreductase [Kribbella sp. NPDC051718]|uniref:nitroreductase family deazaflavin-dependent oxidoreductase n=1 Tax=Kribbella sp. NPDC051718 TaxID=3155168 RepID=UPI003421DE81